MHWSQKSRSLASLEENFQFLSKSSIRSRNRCFCCSPDRRRRPIWDESLIADADAFCSHHSVGSLSGGGRRRIRSIGNDPFLARARYNCSRPLKPLLPQTPKQTQAPHPHHMKTNQYTEEAHRLPKPYRVRNGKKFRLKDVYPGDTGELKSDDTAGAKGALQTGVGAP